MKRVWLGVVLLAVIAAPAFGQNKEQDRVENAGKVMKEILNIPDNIPQEVLDKADCVVVLPSVAQICHRDRRELRPGCDDLPSRARISKAFGALQP